MSSSSFESGTLGIRDVVTSTERKTGKNQPLYSIIEQITKNNLSTSWVDLIPLFAGFPLPIDFRGYSKLGVLFYWRKNGGTGRHDARLINDANDTEVIASTESTPNGLLDNPQINEYLINIPPAFEDWRGKFRIQVKSDNGTDDPIFHGLIIYLRVD